MSELCAVVDGNYADAVVSEELEHADIVGAVAFAVDKSASEGEDKRRRRFVDAGRLVKVETQGVAADDIVYEGLFGFRAQGGEAE